MMNTIIFDFDGTLANTLPLIYDSFQKLFKKYDDRLVTPYDIRSMFGPTEAEMISQYLANRGAVSEAIEEFYSYYKENHRDFVQRHKGIETLLRFVQSQNFKLAIYTGKSRRSLDISLAALDFEGIFDVTITGDDVKNAKPHPEGIERALVALRSKPEDTMFVGDSDADIEGGKRAGVKTIGVQWLPEFQSKHFSILPDLIFLEVTEFIDYLTHLNLECNQDS